MLTEGGVDMSEKGRSRPWRGGTWGCGCTSVVVVLTVGLVLSLFNAAIGLGASVRIPFTSSNLTIAGSLGTKNKAPEVLPGYTQGRLGGNQNFINHSSTLTIGPAEGAYLIVLGKQDAAPIIDLHVEAR
jgi:hypothetical protein